MINDSICDSLCALIIIKSAIKIKESSYADIMDEI